MDQQELEANYFPINVNQLKPGMKRTFPLYVYLPLNQHFMLRFNPEYEITDAVIEKNIRQGISKLWCPKEHRKSWDAYLVASNKANSEQKADAKPPTDAQTEERPQPTAAQSEGIPPEAPLAKTVPAALAIEAMNSEVLDADQKSAILSEIGSEMLGVLGGSAKDPDHDDVEYFKKSMEKCKSFVNDIIKNAAKSHKMRSLMADFLTIAESGLEHSTSVSTLAVLFGMCTGYSEAETLVDLAFGSFLHDTGMALIEASIIGLPFASLTQEQLQEYAKHIPLAFQLIEKSKIELTPQVHEIIAKHHERFDGKGFPAGLAGLEIPEICQLVSIADLLGDLMTQTYDGAARGPAEVLAKLEEIQNQAGARPYFNPELFATIIQAFKQTSEGDGDAEQLVKKILTAA